MNKSTNGGCQLMGFFFRALSRSFAVKRSKGWENEGGRIRLLRS